MLMLNPNGNHMLIIIRYGLLCLFAVSCVVEPVERGEDVIVPGLWPGKGGVLVFRSNAGEWVIRQDVNTTFYWKEGQLDIARSGGIRPQSFPLTRVFSGKLEMLEWLLGYPDLAVVRGPEECVAASSGELRLVDEGEFAATFWPWCEMRKLTR
jgi:hypothetical protein